MAAATTTLRRRSSPLADVAYQMRLVSQGTERLAALPRFAEKLAAMNALPLRATGIEVFQINVGKLCNQTCKHCHVDAGPDR
ncbi:MAG TPA: radical SAM protein, partial [bacterium]|nr:radical SAM protein [bacterium]